MINFFFIVKKLSGLKLVMGRRAKGNNSKIELPMLPAAMGLQTFWRDKILNFLANLNPALPNLGMEARCLVGVGSLTESLLYHVPHPYYGLFYYVVFIPIAWNKAGSSS